MVPSAFSGKVNSVLRRIPSAAIYSAGILPGVLLVGRLAAGDLGPDPLKPLEHGLGLHALQFLIAALCVTPLRRWTGINLLSFRRAFGLVGFFYALAHLMVWLFLDIQLRWSEIAQDLTKRPYIILGMVALLMLVPLAATSNGAAIRSLGAAAWRRLHLLAYPATIAAGLHFMIAVKAWPLEPMLYLGVILALCLARLARGLGR